MVLLKQKILIESLNRTKHSKDKELLVELNSKLDFLVKLFKDSSEGDFDEEDYLKKHFQEVFDRLDKFDQKVEDRLQKVETKIIFPICRDLILSISYK